MNNWISVKDRLPDRDIEFYEKNGEWPDYIVKIDIGKVATALMYDGEDWFDYEGNCYNVTNWMPLPSLPGAPMTNADHIRGMSDEELAEFMVDVEARRSISGGGAKWMTNDICLDWLRQPWEGGEHEPDAPLL